MALVKNQIWSPDEVAKSGGFTEFMKSADGVHSSALSSSVFADPDSTFQVSPTYANAVLEDPDVKRQVEAAIESGLKKRLAAILSHSPSEGHGLSESSIGELEEKIHQLETVLTNGLQEKIESLEKQKREKEALWSAILEKWKAERDQLLHAHEQAWCSAMVYLLERFQAENTQEIKSKIQTWMKSSLQDFSDQDQITVFLNPEDFSKMDSDKPETPGERHWNFAKDSELSKGSIRVQAGNAGAIFSPEKNLDLLKTILQKCL